MMSGIDKISDGSPRPSKVEQDASNAAPRSPAPVGFDATKAAIDQQIASSEKVDAFTAAIREAQDGDSDEAIARRLSLGVDDADRQADGAVLDRVRKGRVKVSAPERDPGAQETETSIAQRAEAAKAKDQVQTSETVTVAPKRSDVARSHHELMLISTTMDRNQTASHVAQSAARKLQAVLDSDLWARDVSRNKRLKLKQVLKAS